jgi:hypothetical protein
MKLEERRTLVQIIGRWVCVSHPHDNLRGTLLLDDIDELHGRALVAFLLELMTSPSHCAKRKQCRRIELG